MAVEDVPVERENLAASYTKPETEGRLVSLQRRLLLRIAPATRSTLGDDETVAMSCHR
jgi:hypothetical protein